MVKYFTYSHDFCVQDKEMKRHGKSNCTQQPWVCPWRHSNQRLVLTQAVNEVMIN